MIAVAKIGTSSVTDDAGHVDPEAVRRLADEVALLRHEGHDVVVVTSGAVAAGAAQLDLSGSRPVDGPGLRALSAIGQHRLMRVYDDALARHHLVGGQVLLAGDDFGERRRYLNARGTLRRLLEIGAVPIVNENDPVADEELRFGDNDRLAALVANLLGAEVLVILTDTAGLFDADPRLVAGARLVDEVREVDAALEQAAGGTGSTGARGGMASKLAAARLAAWSGVRTVIASAARPSVLADAVAGVPGTGTVFIPREKRLSARRCWIAFALRPAGRVVVDAGAAEAILQRAASLLPAGVLEASGHFERGEAIEIATASGEIVAKGVARLAAERSSDWLGRRTVELPPDLAHELVHRDDLVAFVD